MNYIRKNFPNLLLCATVPYILSLSNQVKLAQAFESLGIDIIQTEGKKFGRNFGVNSSVNEKLNEISLTLSATLAISVRLLCLKC